jgi:gliding motility-associated-like protein
MFHKLIVALMLTSLIGWGQPLKFGKLGQGFREFAVRSLFYDTIDKKLYAGGQFKFADNKIVWGAAVWNGTQWDSLRGGFTQFPQDTNQGNTSSFAWQIIRFQNKHYFIGNMVWVNGKNQYHMGVWNGTNWDYPIAQPPNGPIYNLTVHDNVLYAAGMFTKFGNTTCNYVAKFDGVSWQPVGDFKKYIKTYSPPARVQAVQWYKGELYMGGSFLDSAGRNTNIVKYDGTKWTTVGTGIKESFAWVNRMAVFKDELYLGGYFSKTNEIPSSALVKWNGSSFRPYGKYTFNEGTSIYGLLPHKDKLVIMGNLQKLGDFDAVGSMYLDTISGCAVKGLTATTTSSLSYALDQIEFIGDSMVYGGWYKYLDTLVVNNIGVIYNYKNNSNCIFDYTITPPPPVIETPTEVFLPQGISINGDGINDELIIKLPNTQSATLQVFNRWGSQVYKTTETNNSPNILLKWNGTFKNQQVPAGTYFYLIEATLTDGSKKVYKQFVQVVY